MIESVLVALIITIPPTMTAAAAWRQATKGRREAEQANAAVNHVKPGEKSLYEHAASTAEALAEFTAYQHERNHDLLNKIVVTNGALSLLDTKVERYMVDDAAAHEVLRKMVAEAQPFVPRSL